METESSPKRCVLIQNKTMDNSIKFFIIYVPSQQPQAQLQMFRNIIFVLKKEA
jgi:hypothetical protein